MNNKIKKNKKKNEDLSSKKELSNESITNTDITSSSNFSIEKNDNQIKRSHTKYGKKKKNKDTFIKEGKKYEYEEKNKIKKVKFGKIEFINVESWREINLKLTAKENIDEIIEFTNGKEGRRNKKISCTCIVI